MLIGGLLVGVGFFIFGEDVRDNVANATENIGEGVQDVGEKIEDTSKKLR